MPRAHIVFVVAVAVLLVTSGCSGAAPTPPPADTPQSPAVTPTPAPTSASVATAEPSSTRGADGYPGPTSAARPCYPGPVEVTNQESPATDFTPESPTAPAPAEGHGVVTGTLTRDIRGMPLQPISGATLYLAEILRDASGKLAGLASLDEETAPTTTTDEEGRFAFTGVEPGLYILIVKAPLSLVPVREVDAEDVAADVAAGEVAELGIIHSTVTW